MGNEKEILGESIITYNKMGCTQCRTQIVKIRNRKYNLIKFPSLGSLKEFIERRINLKDFEVTCEGEIIESESQYFEIVKIKKKPKLYVVNRGKPFVPIFEYIPERFKSCEVEINRTSEVLCNTLIIMNRYLAIHKDYLQHPETKLLVRNVTISKEIKFLKDVKNFRLYKLKKFQNSVQENFIENFEEEIPQNDGMSKIRFEDLEKYEISPEKANMKSGFPLIVGGKFVGFIDKIKKTFLTVLKIKDIIINIEIIKPRIPKDLKEVMCKILDKERKIIRKNLIFGDRIVVMHRKDAPEDRSEPLIIVKGEQEFRLEFVGEMRDILVYQYIDPNKNTDTIENTTISELPTEAHAMIKLEKHTEKKNDSIKFYQDKTYPKKYTFERTQIKYVILGLFLYNENGQIIGVICRIQIDYVIITTIDELRNPTPINMEPVLPDRMEKFRVEILDENYNLLFFGIFILEGYIIIHNDYIREVSTTLIARYSDNSRNIENTFRIRRTENEIEDFTAYVPENIEDIENIDFSPSREVGEDVYDKYHVNKSPNSNTGIHENIDPKQKGNPVIDAEGKISGFVSDGKVLPLQELEAKLRKVIPCYEPTVSTGEISNIDDESQKNVVVIEDRFIAIDRRSAACNQEYLQILRNKDGQQKELTFKSQCENQSTKIYENIDETDRSKQLDTIKKKYFNEYPESASFVVNLKDDIHCKEETIELKKDSHVKGKYNFSGRYNVRAEFKGLTVFYEGNPFGIIIEVTLDFVLIINYEELLSSLINIIQKGWTLEIGYIVMHVEDIPENNHEEIIFTIGGITKKYLYEKMIGSLVYFKEQHEPSSHSNSINISQEVSPISKREKVGEDYNPSPSSESLPDHSSILTELPKPPKSPKSPEFPQSFKSPKSPKSPVIPEPTPEPPLFRMPSEELNYAIFEDNKLTAYNCKLYKTLQKKITFKKVEGSTFTSTPKGLIIVWEISAYKLNIFANETTSFINGLYENLSVEPRFLERLKISHLYHSSVWHNNKLYVIGGQSTKSVEILGHDDHWEDGPEMPEIRENAASCSFKGKIYLAGGKNMNEFFDTVFRLSDYWEVLQWKTRSKLQGMGLISDNEKMILFGGTGKIRRSFKYYTLDENGHIVKSGEISRSVNFTEKSISICEVFDEKIKKNDKKFSIFVSEGEILEYSQSTGEFSLVLVPPYEEELSKHCYY